MSVKAPYHWLKGSYPRGNTPEVVAHILSERLGEPVEVRQLWPARFAIRADGARQARRAPSGDDLPAARLAAVLDWLVDELGPPVARTAGEPVRPGLLHAIEARAEQVRTLHGDDGGPAALDMAVRDLASVQDVLTTCAYTEAQAVRLHGVVATLGEVAGLAAAGLGRPQEGQRYLLTGLRAAHAAGARALGAQIIAGMAAHCPTPRPWLLNAAVRGAPAELAELHALLRCRQAVIHVRLGDLPAFTKSVGQVLTVPPGTELDAVLEAAERFPAEAHGAELVAVRRMRSGCSPVALDQLGRLLLGSRHMRSIDPPAQRAIPGPPAVQS